jgi:uncharacterized protein (AIM24 family)
MDSRIVGTVMPVLEMSLGPGESLIAEAGQLGWMSESIQLRTSTQMAGSRGVFGAVKRAAAGGGLFMTEYTANGAPGTVAFAAKLPGHILPVPVGPGTEYMVHRRGFLCGAGEIMLQIGYQRTLGAGIFGGEGWVLQHLSGTGQAWVELSGEVISYDLRPGQVLRVHPGHVGMFASTVRFDIVTYSGIKNMIFGGDGLFLAALSGPGRVWLQSLPIANLAHAMVPYLPSPRGDSWSSAGYNAIGAVGRMFTGD